MEEKSQNEYYKINQNDLLSNYHYNLDKSHKLSAQSLFNFRLGTFVFLFAMYMVDLIKNHNSWICKHSYLYLTVWNYWAILVYFLLVLVETKFMRGSNEKLV